MLPMSLSDRWCPNGLAARPGTTAAATVGTVAAASRVVIQLLTTSPVVGSRMTGRKFGLVRKLNRPPRAYRLPEIRSKEPPPIRFPRSQLGSYAPSRPLASGQASGLHRAVDPVG